VKQLIVLLLSIIPIYSQTATIASEVGSSYTCTMLPSGKVCVFTSATAQPVVISSVGTLVNSVCRSHGTGFAPSFTTPLVVNAAGKSPTGAVMLPHEVGGNCIVPPLP
jgi:hypothetical protein